LTDLWLQKGKRPEPILLNAGAFMVGSVRFIRSNLENIMAAPLQKTFVKIQSAIKILILFLYWDSPAKENRQSEKFHSTFNVLRKEREANPSLLLHLLKLEISSMISGSRVSTYLRANSSIRLSISSRVMGTASHFPLCENLINVIL
jgi:hypothetical protein